MQYFNNICTGNGWLYLLHAFEMNLIFHNWAYQHLYDIQKAHLSYFALITIISSHIHPFIRLWFRYFYFDQFIVCNETFEKCNIYVIEGIILILEMKHINLNYGNLRSFTFRICKCCAGKISENWPKYENEL